MKRLYAFAALIIAAVCMNLSTAMAQTNLEFTKTFFQDNTNVTQSWQTKHIKFGGYTADKSWSVNMKINTDHVAGHYTEADCPEYECNIVSTANYDYYYVSTASIDVTQEGNTTTLVGDMVATDEAGTAFHFTIVYEKPEKVEVNAGSISIYDYEAPKYNVYANGADYSVNLSFVSSSNDGIADGEYVIGDYSLLNDKLFYNTVYFAAGSKINVANGTAWNGDACVTITGDVYGEDGVLYALNLTTSLPDPDYTLQVNDDAAVATPDFRENGRWTLTGGTQNVQVTMQLSKDDYAGTYDYKKWNFGYNNTITVGGVSMGFDDAHIVVTDLGEKVNAAGWVLASKDGEVYYAMVDFTADKVAEPAADGDTESDIDIAFKAWEVYSDWMWGGWVLDAENADGYTVHLVSGTYWEEGSDLPEGVYTVTSDWETNLRITPSTYLEGNGGVGPLRAEGDGRTPNGSYVADAEGNFWFIYKGTVTVAYGEDGLNIQCDCENTAGSKVKVNIGANAVATGITTVGADAKNVVKFIKNGQVVIKNNGKLYNVAGSEM